MELPGTVTRASILVVGSINLDLVLRVGGLPKPGTNLIADSYCRLPGGKGANQAVAAARLGAEATFVGCLGNDSDTKFLLRNLAAEGVRTEFLVTAQNAPTGLAVIIVDVDGRNTVLVFPGANMEIGKHTLEAAFTSRKYDLVLLQLEISENSVIETCRLARQMGIPVILDAGPAQEFPLEAIDPIFIITPNESETVALTGMEITSLSNADRAASTLLKRSRAAAAVLKLGKRGAFLKSVDGKSEYFPACEVKEVDTTAAGDAFTAALGVTYIETGNLHTAIKAGNKAGALATTKFGTQASLPMKGELAQFYAEAVAREHAL